MHSSSNLIPIIREAIPGHINTHCLTNHVLRFRNAKPIPSLLSVLHTLQQTQTHDKTQNQKAEGLKVPRLNKFILIIKSVNFRADLIKCDSHCCSVRYSRHVKHSNKTRYIRHDHRTESLQFISLHSYRDSPTYEQDTF